MGPTSWPADVVVLDVERRETVQMIDRWEQTPAGWVAPAGTLPAWNWIPAGHGLSPRLDRVPRWVRIWFRTPFIDRYAYVWMWHHGGWDLNSGEAADPGYNAGATLPRSPAPTTPSTSHQRDLTQS